MSGGVAGEHGQPCPLCRFYGGGFGFSPANTFETRALNVIFFADRPPGERSRLPTYALCTISPDGAFCKLLVGQQNVVELEWIDMGQVVSLTLFPMWWPTSRAPRH